MNIREIKEKYCSNPVDTTLERNLEITAELKHLPDKPIGGGYIILTDSTDSLEAVARAKTFSLLKSYIGKKIKIIGRLDKTEYGNIAFEIEEIVE